MKGPQLACQVYAPGTPTALWAAHSPCVTNMQRSSSVLIYWWIIFGVTPNFFTKQCTVGRRKPPCQKSDQSSRVELRLVMDRQIHTDTVGHSIYHASIASHSKNEATVLCDSDCDRFWSNSITSWLTFPQPTCVPKYRGHKTAKALGIHLIHQLASTFYSQCAVNMKCLHLITEKYRGCTKN